MKIHEAKENLIKALHKITILKSELTDNETLKTEISSILASFTPNVLSSLKDQINRRQKKRIRQRRLKNDNQELKKEAKVLRENQTKEVEIWFKQCQENEARIKAEESVRRQADVVLHGVKRRITEARRNLALLSALSKLRAGRCQQDTASGGQPSVVVTEAFETSLRHLQGLWERQQEGYVKEEAGLRVMLDEGSASRLGRVERELDANLHEWHVAMFGEGPKPEMSWQQLVATRKIWDQYIVAPDTMLSSGLPIGWIMPPEITGQDWKDAVIFD